MAMAVLKDLETNVGPLLANLNKTVQEVHGLLTEVRAQRLPEQAGQMAAAVAAQRFPERVGALLERADRMAAQVEGIIAGLAAGHGIAGKVLADDALAGDVAGMVADLKILTAELRRLAPQVPGLARQAGTTLDRADQVLDGVGRHWLLKDLVRPGDPAYATPSGVVAPVEAAP
jgi:ABC-type transporter Mla subunit MlaD